MLDEDHKPKRHEADRRYREKRKAAGIVYVSTEDSREHNRKNTARRRAAAREAGIILPGSDWAAKNPERHRHNVATWREKNPERAHELEKRHQAKRRSTPWGRINGNLFSMLHQGIMWRVNRAGKYQDALGYTWVDLRCHIESQFTSDMTWDNWGIVWELDHIRPLSSLKFESFDDPRFREAWALSNLRPMLRHLNQAKGAKA